MAIDITFPAVTIEVIYDSEVVTTSCNLTDQGIQSCTINWEVQVSSVNGVIERVTPAHGSVEVVTECSYIASYVDNQHLHWVFADQEVAAQGYEVREPELTFDLPYFNV